MPLCPLVQCNRIKLSVHASVFVPKVKSGKQANVPKVELGEQRIKEYEEVVAI